jgi:anti-sigma regulatory factor (Ser/Thr protein kinase)
MHSVAQARSALAVKRRVEVNSLPGPAREDEAVIGTDPLADTTELIVSELVTNAVHASAGLTASRRAGRLVPGTPPVRLWVFSDKERILIQVWDGNDRHPAPQQTEPDAESGRGLLLVESLSTEWGSYPPERSSGKIVWALVELDQ